MLEGNTNIGSKYVIPLNSDERLFLLFYKFPSEGVIGGELIEVYA